MELIIALVLFLGMIASWIMLPGGTPASAAHTETEVVSSSPARQAA